MSTLEKAINLLQSMPEPKIEAVYTYMRFVYSQSDDDPIPSESGIKASMEGLRVLQSFAGTLPEDFDYEQELEDARREKCERDFEDCLQDECAKQVNADYIVTRNIKDFSKSDIPAVTPEIFLKILEG